MLLKRVTVDFTHWSVLQIFWSTTTCCMWEKCTKPKILLTKDDQLQVTPMVIFCLSFKSASLICYRSPDCVAETEFQMLPECVAGAETRLEHSYISPGLSVCLKMSFQCQNVRRVWGLWKMGPMCTLMITGQQNQSQSVPSFTSLFGLNRLRTCCSSPKGVGQRRNPRQEMTLQWAVSFVKRPEGAALI